MLPPEAMSTSVSPLGTVGHVLLPAVLAPSPTHDLPCGRPSLLWECLEIPHMGPGRVRHQDDSRHDLSKWTGLTGPGRWCSSRTVHLPPGARWAPVRCSAQRQPPYPRHAARLSLAQALPSCPSPNGPLGQAGEASTELAGPRTLSRGRAVLPSAHMETRARGEKAAQEAARAGCGGLRAPSCGVGAAACLSQGTGAWHARLYSFRLCQLVFNTRLSHGVIAS